MAVHAERAKFWLFSILLAFVALAPGWAAADDRRGLHRPFDGIVVFGDSLSDPGNAFALTSEHLTPPSYGMTTPADLLTLIPDAPYARGGNHFSNGPTWIEDLGRSIGLAASVGPAFAPGHANATNYAVGGARARPVGSFHLAVQVGAFLADFPRGAPADALYVVALGGNDVRDALALGGDSTVIAAAIGSIAQHIPVLYAAGARKFLVWNAPNIGVTPAVRAIAAANPTAPVLAAAEQLSFAFKLNLESVLAGLAAAPQLAGIEIVRFDAFIEINRIVANPAAFGLTNVTTACITPNVPPFQCQRPDRHLFWDGIHPTRAGHAITALRAGEALVSGLALDH
jgi:phospholipase/lecithinase/hemolysin